MRCIAVFLLLGFASVVLGQSKIVEWFPSNSVFPNLAYDLLELQTYTGVFLLNANAISYEGAYIPVNLAIKKTFLNWDMLNIKFDFSMGAASYTQFEIIRYDAQTLRGGLLNTDFKASGFLNASYGDHKFRVQLFHVSSHLGDDFMLRNEYFELNDKTVNYEQIDFTYLFKPKQIGYYIGIGEVITPNAFRKRFMFEFGFQGEHMFKEKMGLAYGSDVKLYAENNYEPDMHFGFGFVFKKQNKKQLNIGLDGYFGTIPYSTLNFGKVYWVGISSKIYI